VADEESKRNGEELLILSPPRTAIRTAALLVSPNSKLENPSLRCYAAT